MLANNVHKRLKLGMIMYNTLVNNVIIMIIFSQLCLLFEIDATLHTILTEYQPPYVRAVLRKKDLNT